MPKRAAEMNDRQRHGARLQVFREWLGLTQEEMARWVTGNHKSSKSPISAAEQGARPVPTQSLYKLFGLSQDWVLGYTDDDWWGPEVRRIRAHLLVWLRALTPEENAEYGHPGARVAASYVEIGKVSRLVTELYAAAILNVDVKQFLEVISDETFVSPEQWGRWAEWTNLPEQWIAKGHLPPKEHEQKDPYEPVIEEARRNGITAEKLLSMIRIMAK